jgi:hypothetical protein
LKVNNNNNNSQVVVDQITDQIVIITIKVQEIIKRIILKDLKLVVKRVNVSL